MLRDIFAFVFFIISIYFFCNSKKRFFSNHNSFVYMILISSLCLFANNPIVYCLGIVIAATLITTKDFLIRILCVLRGTKSQAIKELLTILPLNQEDNKIKYEKITEKEKECIKNNIQKESLSPESLKKTYNLLFDKLEKEYGIKIQRDLLLEFDSDKYNVDGFFHDGAKALFFKIYVSLSHTNEILTLIKDEIKIAEKLQYVYSETIHEIILIGDFSNIIKNEAMLEIENIPHLKLRFCPASTICGFVTS